MKNFLKRFDEIFIDLINGKMSNRFLDKFMYRFTDLGGAIFNSVIACSFLLLGDRSIRLLGLEALGSLGLSQLIVQALKRGLGRERPYKILENLHTFGINMKDYSFPSGHTTASFSLATIIGLNIPRVWILVVFLALIVGISRVYLAVHYPTDVVAGMMLGIGCSLIVHFQLLKIIEDIGIFIGII
ncbi:phosphatase PAP2 family protein [Wansuia hejianensis]|uniref:Phosphatase PAP2 family protein n=1 Tax=Wansuia hejianensis TaxID=2763667 RepID=A0A926F174_9FIRM|nr:phosphatase PAP2 family protein [Wansuia hejianensis]MBC8591486.1 phosphatase PAP2 family protein [Wansuia hejianensis]